MSYLNGQFPLNALGKIPGGYLQKDAAAAWNAPGGPADSGLRITGPNSGYRSLQKQQEYYAAYKNGTGNLAAYPGTSNHGWGLAVDLAETWMADWMRANGAKYGFRKTEAPSEWWHFNFVGGVGPFPPPFKVMKHGQRGIRIVKMTRKLAYIRGERGHRYLKRRYFKFKDAVVRAVKDFQNDKGLKSDGVVGPKTYSLLEKAFKNQWRNKH